MTRKPRDDRQRVFLTAEKLENMAMRQYEAEHSYPAQGGDVLQAAAFGAVVGGFAALLAHGLALAMGRPGYAMQLVAFGAVALVGALIRAGQIADSRRSRQWATFDAPQPETAKPDFVPVGDTGRTLVLDSPLRRKAEKWAALLPSVGYSLAYTNWIGRGKLLSRGEYDKIRATMRALNYEANDELTERGKAAVARWSVDNFRAGESHALRGGE